VPPPAPAAKAPAPAPKPAPAPRSWASGPTHVPGQPELEALRLDFSTAGSRGRLHLFAKPELHLGAFAALNDIVLRCFPRDLENDKDALERSESIGASHLSLRLTRSGVELVDGATGKTKIGGEMLEAGATHTLTDAAEVELGEDTLGLRVRLFLHPRLKPTDPALGLEHKHPVECVVVERKGDGADHLYVLLVRQASVGSNDETAVCIPVPGVAPLHALLFVKDGQMWLSQLGDSPVAAGGVALAPGMAVPLTPGLKIFIGPVTIDVHETAPEDFEPAW
jgi:hypothetical protein